jgi:DNA transformation protein
MNIATARNRALECAERLRARAPIEVTRFLGGAGLRMDGVQFGLIMKGALYLRVDERNRFMFEASHARPFAYAGHSHTVKVASYYEAPDEVADDPDELVHWARDAHRAALAAKRTSRQRRP